MLHFQIKLFRINLTKEYNFKWLETLDASENLTWGAENQLKE